MRYTVLLILLTAQPVFAQDKQVSQVANSAVGQVGQRQVHEQAVAGIKPMTRINGRLQSRIESRIRNRIDRNYDPEADAVSPFKVAGERAKRLCCKD